jgi:Zn-dependent protease
MPIGKYTTIGGVRPLGAALQVHWSVFVVGLLLLLGGIESPVRSLLALAAYLSIILVHELGHGLMARSVGCRVHIIQLGYFHGHCIFEAPFDKWDHMKIAWAGVLAQLAAALLIYLPVAIFPSLHTGAYGVVVIFLVYFNIFIALFNLAPSKGLDGYLAWQVIPLLRQQLKARAASKKALRKLYRE